MKIVLATAAILAALAAPSFAETVGTDAAGSDHGSFRLSQVDPAQLATLVMNRERTLVVAAVVGSRAESVRDAS